MTTVFRAEDEPVTGRLDYWRHVVGDTVVPMDIRFDHGPRFRGRIMTAEVGPVRVTEVHEGAGVATRTPRHIRRSAPEMYQVLVQGRGYCTAEQDGRSARLGPGDLGICDPSRPFRCLHSARHAVCLTFPRALLPLPQEQVARLTGTRIPGDGGTGELVSSFLRRLPRHLDGGEGHARLASAAIDLVTVVLANRLGDADAAPPDARQAALLRRIEAFIDRRLGDPALTPPAIAAAHHISLRYLHRLFERAETTVAAHIRARRLDRCRRDLLDSANAALSVHAIGARWGFTDPSHFNRVFRAAYGVPPGEFRSAYASSSALRIRFSDTG
jgi:AraC-like DNA-binding protein